MRVSADELVRMAQWLLRARGLTRGNEDEPARAVLWLVLRRDGVLEALERALLTGCLAPGRDAMPPPAIELPRPRCLLADAGGASALTLAPLFLDWLDAATGPAGQAPDTGAEVEVTRLAAPQWLLPALALRPALSPVQVEVFANGSGAPLMRLRREQAELVTELWQPWDSLWESAVRVRMQCPGGAGAGAPSPAIERIESALLDARAGQVLERGIEVDAQLWQRLSAITLDAMVPESEASRARGAGGGDDGR